MKTYLDVELHYYYYYKYIMRMYIKNLKVGGRRRQGAAAARVIFQFIRRELQDFDLLSMCLSILPHILGVNPSQKPCSLHKFVTLSSRSNDSFSLHSEKLLTLTP